MADREYGPLPDVDPDRCDPQPPMALVERFPHGAAPRVPALLAACRRYHVDPYRQAEADEVDVWLIVTGDIPAPRYLAIQSGGGDDRRASLHHTLDDAQAHAASGVHETLWNDWPVAVVDLDTGQQWQASCVVTWTPSDA
jgi:hypothetical protein